MANQLMGGGITDWTGYTPNITVPRPNNPFNLGGNADKGWLDFFNSGMQSSGISSTGSGENISYTSSGPSPFFDKMSNSLVMPGMNGGFSVIPDAQDYLSYKTRANLNGRPSFNYGGDGTFSGQGTASGFHNGDGALQDFGIASLFFLPAAAAAIGGLGAGAAGAAEGAGGVTGLADGAALDAMYGGLDAGATLGGGAMGAGGAAAGTTLGSLFNGNSIFNQLGGKMLTGGLSSIFGGNGSTGGGGGFNLGDITNVLGGLYGSQQQGQAADKMLNWMNDQTNYVRNYGQPGTPEFDYLKNTLEAKDAAAGRNSQYGTRSRELLGQLGQAKLDASSRMALGLAPAYSRAINQDANKYAGLPAAINKLLGGGGGINLGQILNGLTSGTSGGGSSIDDFFNAVGPEGMPIDYSGGMGQPTEADVLPFLDDLGGDWWS